MDSFIGEGVQCKQTINTEEPSSVINEGEESLGGTVDDSQSMKPPFPTVLCRSKPMEVVAAGETVKDAVVTLKERMNSRRIQEDDECDLHVKFIAKKLRKLPENERMRFECDIYNLFLKHEQRNPALFSPSSASPTPQPTYSYDHTQRHFSQTRACSAPTTSYHQRAHSSHSCYSETPIYYYSSRIPHSR